MPGLRRLACCSRAVPVARLSSLELQEQRLLLGCDARVCQRHPCCRGAILQRCGARSGTSPAGANKRALCWALGWGRHPAAPCSEVPGSSWSSSSGTGRNGSRAPAALGVGRRWPRNMSQGGWAGRRCPLRPQPLPRQPRRPRSPRFPCRSAHPQSRTPTAGQSSGATVRSLVAWRWAPAKGVCAIQGLQAPVPKRNKHTRGVPPTSCAVPAAASAPPAACRSDGNAASSARRQAAEPPGSQPLRHRRTALGAGWPPSIAALEPACSAFGDGNW